MKNVEMKEENKLFNETKREDLSAAIFALIHDNPEGLSIAELQAKTGFSEPEIFGIVFSATKVGRLKMVSQGVYANVDVYPKYATGLPE